VSQRGRRPHYWQRALAVPALAGLALTAACGGPVGGSSATTVTLVPQPGGQTTVGIDQAPSGCNPNTTNGDTWADHLVLAPVLPSAFVVDADGNSVGNQALATSAELVNTTPQTIVYTINPKAVWSDGVHISATDFVYAWQQQRGDQLETGTDNGAATNMGYRDIRTVTGSNHGLTVTVVFKTPFADWRMLFADLLPAHVLERTGWNPACTTVDPAVDLSGGPFVIKSVSTYQVVLTANPRWWGGATDLSRMTIRFASGPAQLSTWLRRGVVQVVEPTSFSQPFLEAGTADPSVSSQVNIASDFLQLEFSTTGPATTNPVLRQAMAHAVDRQALLDAVVGFADSNIVPSASHIYLQTQSGYPNSSAPPSSPNAVVANGTTTSTSTTAASSSSAAYPPTAEPVTTAELLTSQGYINLNGQWLDANGHPVALRLVADGGDAFAEQTATLLAHQLQHAGFEVTLSLAPSAVAAGSDLATGNADLALLPFTTSPYLSNALAWYTPTLGTPGDNGSENWSNLDDPAINSLLTKAANSVPALNPVMAAPFYQQADQLLWKDMVALPLFAEPNVILWSNRLYNVQPNFHGPGLLWEAQLWEVEVPQSSTTTTSGG
jgi:peptide/nickel transport system substrate-binding protein